MNPQYIVVILNNRDDLAQVSKFEDPIFAQELVSVARAFGDTATTLIVRDKQFAVEGP